MNTLAIIGGGVAGYTAAERALKNGLFVILFEKNNLGGTCLNEGCIPTKTLLYSAKQFSNLKTAEKYGVLTENVRFDYTKMQARKTKVLRKLMAGIKQRLNNPNCRIVNGEAIVEKYSQEKINISCNNELFEADYLLLCTGSENIKPPILGIDSASVWDSTNALNCKELPKQLIVVGGGVIGVELAVLFAMLGVQVSVIELMPEIISNMDSEIATMLREILSKSFNIKFFMQTKLQAIDEKEVWILGENQVEKITADNILISVGRCPNLVGLEKLPLKMHNKGVAVDSAMRTNLPNVFAAGDITGFSMLAHTAAREAEVAVANICGQTEEMHYNAVPCVVYTNPEVAGVGETEESLIIKKIDYAVAKLPMSFSGRFVAENEGVNGLCKILYDKNSKIILGVHLLGNSASEIVNLAAMAIQQKMTLIDWRKNIYAHPTVCEILKETMWNV